MGAAKQALYFLFHPSQLRSIIQWYALAHMTSSLPARSLTATPPLGSSGMTLYTVATPQKRHQHKHHVSASWT